MRLPNGVLLLIPNIWVYSIVLFAVAVDACPYVLSSDAQRIVTAHVAAESCSVSFHSERLNFQSCRVSPQDGINVYWNINGSNIETLVSGKPASGGYISWGWGGNAMVGTSAVVAFTDPTSGKAVVNDYYLASERSSGVQIGNRQNISRSSIEIGSDGTITAHFVRPLEGIAKGSLAPAIWAIGPKVSDPGKLQEHSRKGVWSLDLSSSGIAKPVDGATGGSRVIRAHMILMGSAWLIFAPLGVFAMRYLKNYNPGTFQAHRAIMTSVVFIVATAYVLGILKGSRDGGLNIAHFGIGTVVLALALFQVAFGYMRPHKGTGKRKMFNVVHWWSGRSALVLAAINSFIGLGLSSANSKWIAFLSVIVLGWIGVFAVFSCLLGNRFPISDERPDDGLWTNGGMSIHAAQRVTVPT